MTALHLNSPLYEQVRLDILKRVRRGEFPLDAPIPNEAALCKEYGVSRITIRRALGDLCTDDILYRRQGIGTFVSDPVRTAQSIKLRGNLSDVLADDPRLVFRLDGWTGDVTDPDALDAAGELGRVVRLDFEATLKGEPFALSQFHVSADEFDPALADRLNGSRQPILWIAEHVRRPLASAHQVVTAAGADALAARILRLPEGAPILRLRRSYLDTNGRVIAVTMGHFLPDHVEIVATLQLFSASGSHGHRG